MEVGRGRRERGRHEWQRGGSESTVSFPPGTGVLSVKSGHWTRVSDPLTQRRKLSNLLPKVSFQRLPPSETGLCPTLPDLCDFETPPLRYSSVSPLFVTNRTLSSSTPRLSDHPVPSTTGGSQRRPRSRDSCRRPVGSQGHSTGLEGPSFLVLKTDYID